MTGNNKVWRMPVACLASVAMLATVGVSAMTANAEDATVAPYNFDVTFDMNGRGENVVLKSTDSRLSDGVLDQSDLNSMKPIESGGWTFTGWYTASEYGSEKFEPGTFLNADTTLYAHWAEPDDLVTFNFWKGSDEAKENKTVKVAEQDKKIAAWEIPGDTPDDQKVVTGWTTSPVDDPTSVAVSNEDLTTDFTGKLSYADPGAQTINLNPVTIPAATVEFKDGMGNRLGDLVDVAYGDEIPLPEGEAAYSNNLRVTEWTDEMNGNVTSATTVSESNVTNAGADRIWTVRGTKWQKAFKVGLYTEINGVDRAFDSVIVDEGAKGEYPAPPARNSGTFSMYTEGVNKNNGKHSYDTVAFDKAVNADTDLAAQWAVDSVYVTFDYNYAGKKTTQSYGTGDEFTVPTAERDGYMLLGWYVNSDGSNPFASGDAEFEYSEWTADGDPDTDLNNGTHSIGYYASKQIPVGAKMRVTSAGVLQYFKVNTAAGVDGNNQQTTTGAWVNVPGTLYAAWQLADNDQLNNVENRVSGLYDEDGDYAETSEFFTDASWKQYVKDYQAYVAHKTELGASDGQLSNAEAAELMAELQAAQAKLVQKAGLKVYRMYNPFNGDHLYTGDKHEYDALLKIGWKGEGVKFNVTASNASTQAGFGTAVYRLYNPFTGEHLLTTDANEVEILNGAGWLSDNQGEPVFYAPQGGDVQVTRLYNPYATVGTHLYTIDQEEVDVNMSLGWLKDDVAFAATK